MAIAEDLRKTLSDPTPLYALAGAGDLAVEKLKTVPERAAALAADRKAAQEAAASKLGEAQTLLNEAQTKVSEAVQTLPTDLKSLQTDLKSLQEKAQGLALQGVGRAAELAVKAREAYDELAARGKSVVDRQFNGNGAVADTEPAIEAADAPSAPVAKADVFAAETEEPEAEAEADTTEAPAAEAETPAPKPARKSTARKPRANG